MKKIRLKSKSKIRKSHIMITIIALILFVVIMMISFINKKLTPIIIEIAEPEIKKISTIVVNNSVNRVLEKEFDEHELFNTILSSDGKIQTIDFNSMLVNKILNLATTAVQTDLKFLEEGNLENIGIESINLSQNKIDKLKSGIVKEIPIGIVFQNSLLSNIGPKIPIRLHYIGNVDSNIVTRINSYGVNNALMEIGIKLDVTAQIVLPLTTKKIRLDCYIPIAIKIIQGTVPDYYSSGIENQSHLYSLPF